MLETYKGHAALLWTNPNDPTTLYVFHGASKKFSTDKVLTEERPMYYMKTNEGLYFSSMFNSLMAIRDEDWQFPEELECNKVFQITNGKFTKKVVDIHRENVNCIGYTNYNYDADHYDYYDRPWRKSNTKILKKEDTVSPPDINLAWYETKPLSTIGKEKIYYRKGRYWMPDDTLCDGVVHIKGRAIVGDTSETDTNPYYFIAGVMIKSKEDYDYLKKQATDYPNSSWVVNRKNNNFAFNIVKYSKYPITNLEDEFTNYQANITRYRWYDPTSNNGFYTKKGSFTPAFTGRHYLINAGGFLYEIKSSDQNDKKTIDFGKEEKATVNQGIIPFSGSIFDKTFSSTDNIMSLMSGIEATAIKKMVEDLYKKNNTLDPDEDEILNDCYLYINQAKEEGKTIRAILGDTTNKLELYMEQAKLEAIGVVEDIDDDTIEDADIIIEEEGYSEDEIAKEKIENIIDILQDLNNEVDTLVPLSTSNLAQESANKVYRGLDNIKHGLSEVLLDEKEDDLNKRLNQKVSSIL